jgi:Skp family chaperone for outer membrane proteins
MRRIFVATFLILLVCSIRPWLSPVRALEVSLEENKFEKGGVGFVDMHVLFKQSPQTEKAKLEFADAMHQAEEMINLRRSEIIGLKAEIVRLQAEKDFIIKSSSAPIVGTLPPKATKKGESSKPSAPKASSASPPTGALPASSIPGIFDPRSPHPANSTGVPGSATPSPAPSPARTQTATGTNQGQPTTASSPSASAVNPSASQAKIQELDRTIAEKQKILDAKQADFKMFEAQAEKTLLDLESRKTEVLLGRIYGAIQEVAKNENISVVVDKSQILFGHKAVDLTEPVLKKLKGE